MALRSPDNVKLDHFTFKGTLSNDDGDAMDQAQMKMSLYFSVELEWKYKKLAAVVHVLQTTQNLVILRCCLQRTANKCTKISNAREQPLYCSSFVQWRSRSRCRRGFVIAPNIVCVTPSFSKGTISKCFLSTLKRKYRRFQWLSVHITEIFMMKTLFLESYVKKLPGDYSV